MPLGDFDTDGFATTWWDVSGNVAGWWDKDAIPFPGTAPVPPVPPSPPRPPRPPPVSRGGGNAVFIPSDLYVPPAWLPQWVIPFEECKDEATNLTLTYITPPRPLPEEVADFALMYTTPPQGAVVKALADGVVKTTIDAKGRTSIILIGDDGTRYLYADVGMTTVADGARVRAGQGIARTKPGAPSIPEITTTRRPELSAAGAVPQEPKKPKPAQVVFIDPPPEVEEPPPLPQPRRWVRLEPINPPPPAPWYASPIVRTVATAGLFATLIYVLVSLDPKPPRKPRTPTPRRQKRRKR